MNRRNFITKSSLVFGGISLLENFPNDISSGNINYFLAKSGVIGTNNSVCLGILKTNDLDNDNEWILRERNNFNFHSEIRYSSNDKYKVPFAKSLIDYFVSRDSLSFALTRLPQAPAYLSNDGNHLNSSRLQKAKLKAEYLEMLLKELDAGSTCNVTMKAEYSFGSGRQFHDIMGKNPTINTVDKIYYEEDLLQLASLITGCIKADLSNAKVNAVNTQIITHLKGTLGVLNFNGINNDKLKII